MPHWYYWLILQLCAEGESEEDEGCCCSTSYSWGGLAVSSRSTVNSHCSHVLTSHWSPRESQRSKWEIHLAVKVRKAVTVEWRWMGWGAVLSVNGVEAEWWHGCNDSTSYWTTRTVKVPIEQEKEEGEGRNDEWGSVRHHESILLCPSSTTLIKWLQAGRLGWQILWMWRQKYLHCFLEVAMNYTSGCCSMLAIINHEGLPLNA